MINEDKGSVIDGVIDYFRKHPFARLMLAVVSAISIIAFLRDILLIIPLNWFSAYYSNLPWLFYNNESLVRRAYLVDVLNPIFDLVFFAISFYIGEKADAKEKEARHEAH